MLAELLDRDAAVLEDPGLAVDVGDRRAAGGGVGEGRVIAHQPEVVLGDLDLAQVHRPDGPVGDLELVGLAGAVVGDAQRVATGEAPSLSALDCSAAFSSCLVGITPPCASGIACSQQTRSPGPVSHDALIALQRNRPVLRAQRRRRGAGPRARFLGRRTYLGRRRGTALARSFEVVTYDRRGHSRSVLPPTSGTIHDDVADLAGLHRGAGSAARARGRSIGGRIDRPAPRRDSARSWSAPFRFTSRPCSTSSTTGNLAGAGRAPLRTRCCRRAPRRRRSRRCGQRSTSTRSPVPRMAGPDWIRRGAAMLLANSRAPTLSSAGIPTPSGIELESLAAFHQSRARHLRRSQAADVQADR